MKRLRIGFMGTPDFAAAALKALCETSHEIVCVYTQPPRPKGRGQKVQISPVHEFAHSRNIPVFHPQNFKAEETRQEFAAHNLDIAIVAAYGLILPQAVLDAPKYGCINIHASLLPRWRGASPIQRSIWAGDSESGVTLMQMDKGLDTGDMIVKKSVPITSTTTASSLHDVLMQMGGDMIVDLVNQLARGETLSKEKQDDAQSNYAPLLSKDDGRVNWSQSAEEIDRQIRALNRWPGVWTMLGDKRLKILDAKISNENAKAAHIINREGDVGCGKGSLKLLKIQPENAKPMDFAAAVNGGYLKIGEFFK